jgi:hypothetical protein
MEIKLGDFDLIYSISVIQINDLPIRIKLPDSIEGDYTITFQFTKDEQNKATITKVLPVDKFHLNVEFGNFYDSNPVGNVNLLELGTLRNLKLFLNYRVVPLVGSTRTVLFNFYTRKEV